MTQWMDGWMNGWMDKYTHMDIHCPELISTLSP